jgi:hypothetical protein
MTDEPHEGDIKRTHARFLWRLVSFCRVRLFFSIPFLRVRWWLGSVLCSNSRGTVGREVFKHSPLIPRLLMP